MERRYGKSAFDNKGKIKKEYLERAKKNADEKTKKRIVFALNVRK